jgi:hypothetical protein
MIVMATSHRSTRTVWLKRMHTWHWISSATALTGILFFSVTGLTLNHAEALESTQQTYRSERKIVPVDLIGVLNADIRRNGEGQAEPSAPLRRWIRQAFGVDPGGRDAEWKANEIDLSLERPGGDAWLKVDLDKGIAEYHVSDAGWIAFFNDLHKGRHIGKWWSWLIDLIAISCVTFAVTGFVILKMHAHHRPLTWPIVGLGLLIPVLLAIVLLH